MFVLIDIFDRFYVLFKGDKWVKKKEKEKNDKSLMFYEYNLIFFMLIEFWILEWCKRLYLYDIEN